MSILYGCFNAGSVLSMALTPFFATSLGWPSAFRLFAILGLIWAVRFQSCKTAVFFANSSRRSLVVHQATDAVLKYSHAAICLILAHFCSQGQCQSLVRQAPCYLSVWMRRSDSPSHIFTSHVHAHNILSTGSLGLYAPCKVHVLGHLLSQ